ncbi:hypothetical protein EKH77_02360 [Streptomyces luteoverticillatus]|uniref:Uncharacterized protein n=1 Tax=Streptomyces luteoverticillatus TaxID=66425 RepID=A0A3Q9FTC0_STRLT|nr:hypothetical protein [Streptomyces luteoverticillatus]AZQ70209.1 hypothetical protein EKH77_02360 [Streptomyces luteoverticillatus]
MPFNTARPVALRLWMETRNHPDDDHDGDHHDGFGGGHGPHPHPDGPPEPGPHDADVAEGPFRVVRPADMLVVDINLVNLRFDGHRLVRKDPGEPAFVLVGLPPQHVMEEVPAPLGATPLGPMRAFTAGSSHLSFSVPATMDGLDLSLASLLDWARLVPITVPVGPQGPDAPGSAVFQGIPRSVLEFPTRLLVTYDEPVGWAVPSEPPEADGPTALWHARLRGTQDDEVLLRAFATVGGRGVLPVPTPLSAENLEDIVTLTSRVELPGPGGGPPLEIHSAPLHAEQFIVTPLGSSAHLHGAWQPLSQPAQDRFTQVGRRPPNLVLYDHITGLGRDQFVRTATHGRMSTGHEAVHFKEFRRVFVARPNDGIVAYLQRQDRIVIKQPEVQYGPSGYRHEGREMPFSTLRITDRVTPLIQQPGPDPDAFWVILQDSGKDHEFTLIGTDCEGRKVSFTMPLAFVADGVPQERVNNLYDPAQQPRLGDRLNRSMGGQVMAMAQPPPGAPGSTSHAVGTLTFGLGIRNGNGKDRDLPVIGLPFVSGAAVRVPAVEQFTPNGGDLPVAFNETYLQQTMAAHPAGAYLDLEKAVSLTFGAEKAGGVASPNAAVKVITTQAGVIPEMFKKDSAGQAVDALDIGDIRKAFDGAKMLGFISLGDILKSVTKDTLGALRKLGDAEIEAILRDANGLLPAPVLRIRDLVDGQGKELRYVWKPSLERPASGPAHVLDVSKASLILDARTVRSKDAVDQSTVEGRLSHFALDFEGIARLDFAELKFKASPGRKPDVSASGLELKFSKDLEFINSLRSALPADAFGPGSYLDVQPTGIRAGFKLALPAIGLGAFTLSNLSLGAELDVPFEDKPVSFRFSVSERVHPFNVTVSLFGGGGYFSMLIDAKGVQQVEGAIEFGGATALNLGVASGGVSVMAGVRFLFSRNPDNVTLGGYLRCNGNLTVLGIITVTAEFYLELTYEKHGHESVVRGRGTLTVGVRIAFFSKSVSLTLERSFSGAPGDPSFTQCVLPGHWHEYCRAFAA